MLRDVKHHITDKNLGFATATGDGRHLKIGVSPVVSDTPIVVTGAMDAAQIKSRLERQRKIGHNIDGEHHCRII